MLSKQSQAAENYFWHQKTERHFGIYAFYAMFYPQLVAGSIERPQKLLHQLREKYAFNADRMFDGLKTMVWGLFKKLVVAERLGIFKKIAQEYNISFLITPGTVFI